METTLHRQLKALYCPDDARQEVAVEGYRIDAVAEGRLVEVQYGSLAAIRGKVATLLQNHRVTVVKPLAGRKYLVTRKRRRGRVASARYSPIRQNWYDLFEDLVHFVGVFPHRGLILEAVLTEQEEHRRPARSRRWRSRGYRVDDRRIRRVIDRLPLKTACDLARLLPDDLPIPFTTADIAEKAGIPRWLAQKMAYCLRKTRAVETVGKRKNAVLYRVIRDGTARAA